jgi:hypothetical protein
MPPIVYEVTQHHSNRSFRVEPSGRGLHEDTIPRESLSSGFFAATRRIRILAVETNSSQPVWCTAETELIQHVAQQDQWCEGIVLQRRPAPLRPAQVSAEVDNGDEKRVDVLDIGEVFPLG